MLNLFRCPNPTIWRDGGAGFAAGNREIIEALARIKGYYDYGIFAPIQVAAIMALRTPEDTVMENAAVYQKRRECTC